MAAATSYWNSKDSSYGLTFIILDNLGVLKQALSKWNKDCQIFPLSLLYTDPGSIVFAGKINNNYDVIKLDLVTGTSTPGTNTQTSKYREEKQGL